jgi:hypothetical protein
MPYKNHQDFVRWNRDYQRRRAAEERAAEASLEDQILALIEQHGEHTTYSLYVFLRSRGHPFRLVRKAISELVRGGLLNYALGGRLIPSPAWEEERRRMEAVSKGEEEQRKLAFSSSTETGEGEQQ